jgi:hypothetical protein
LKISSDCSGRCEDSCGSSGTGETPQAFTLRRLTARPTESEAPGTEITGFKKKYLNLIFIVTYIKFLKFMAAPYVPFTCEVLLYHFC